MFLPCLPVYIRCVVPFKHNFKSEEEKANSSAPTPIKDICYLHSSGLRTVSHWVLEVSSNLVYWLSELLFAKMRRHWIKANSICHMGTSILWLTSVSTATHSQVTIYIMKHVLPQIFPALDTSGSHTFVELWPFCSNSLVIRVWREALGQATVFTHPAHCWVCPLKHPLEIFITLWSVGPILV